MNAIKSKKCSAWNTGEYRCSSEKEPFQEKSTPCDIRLQKSEQQVYNDVVANKTHGLSHRFARATVFSKDVGMRPLALIFGAGEVYQQKCRAKNDGVDAKALDANDALQYWQRRICEHTRCGGIDSEDIPNTHRKAKEFNYKFTIPQGIVERGNFRDPIRGRDTYCSSGYRTKESRTKKIAVNSEPRNDLSEIFNGIKKEDKILQIALDYLDKNVETYEEEEQKVHPVQVKDEALAQKSRKAISKHLGKYGPYSFGIRTGYPSAFDMDQIHDGSNHTCYVRSAAILLSCLNDDVKKSREDITKLFQYMREPYTHAKDVHDILYKAMTAEPRKLGGIYAFNELILFTYTMMKKNLFIKVDSSMDLAYVDGIDKNSGSVHSIWKNGLKELANTKKRHLLFNVRSFIRDKDSALSDVFRAANAVEDYKPIACTVVMDCKGGALLHVETLFFDKQSNMWWCPTVCGESATPAGYTLEEAIASLKEKYKRAGKQEILDMQIATLLLEKNTVPALLEESTKYEKPCRRKYVDEYGEHDSIVHKNNDGSTLLYVLGKSSDSKKEYVKKILYGVSAYHEGSPKNVVARVCNYDEQGKLVSVEEYCGKDNRIAVISYEDGLPVQREYFPGTPYLKCGNQTILAVADECE